MGGGPGRGIVQSGGTFIFTLHIDTHTQRRSTRGARTAEREREREREARAYRERERERDRDRDRDRRRERWMDRWMVYCKINGLTITISMRERERMNE